MFSTNFYFIYIYIYIYIYIRIFHGKTEHDKIIFLEKKISLLSIFRKPNMTLSLWLIQEGAYEPVETLNQYDFFEGDYTITQIKSQPSLYVTIFSSLTY